MSATVVVTSRSFSSGAADVESRLAEAGLRVVRADASHAREALAPMLSDAIAWIAGTAPVTADLLDLAPRLRIVARYGVGFDAVDLEAARARGIAVTNTPGANSASVADLALALTLASLRRVVTGMDAVRRRDWSAIRGREIATLRVGIVGFGRIGRHFADRVRALGADCLVHDPYLAGTAELPDRTDRTESLAELAGCDAVSLHAPGGRCLVDRDWLANARQLALVNTARADLIDEQAVAEALRAGRLASYAADTLGVEGGAPGRCPLMAADLADRVVVTPHLGAQTVQSIDRMGLGAAENVLAVVAGRPPVNPVS
ncbi:MAG: NAD(P)-dependent oxidoreductase [Nocardioides sp.]|uniref:NAD(P)-dependent oxidoreductase n=1 Tax=Nocardioides sp. TaxID=35761 RepID=UPI0039E3B84F